MQAPGPSSFTPTHTPCRHSSVNESARGPVIPDTEDQEPERGTKITRLYHGLEGLLGQRRQTSPQKYDIKIRTIKETRSFQGAGGEQLCRGGRGVFLTHYLLLLIYSFILLRHNSYKINFTISKYTIQLVLVTILCNHPHDLVPEHFCHPKMKSYTH